MHPPRTLVLATILGVLLSACTPSTGPSSTPTPAVPMCTPEFGGDAYPCTQAEREQTLARDARYADAERVYREFVRLNTLEYVERRDDPSAELRSLVTSEYADVLAQIRKQSLSQATFSGSLRVDWVRPTPAEGSRWPMALLVCLDYRDLDVSFTDGTAGPSGRIANRVDFDVAPTRPQIADILQAQAGDC